MSRSASGDNKAFAMLYDRFSKKMYHYFYRMLWNDEEKAQDFTQDLFMKVIEKPHLYDEGRKFSTWLYSIATNMCKNEYRSHDVRKKANVEISHTHNHSSINNENTDYDFFKKDLQQAIELLNNDQRMVFIMRHKQGFKTRQIAEFLDCSEGTVKSRLFYALKILSKELSAYNKTNLL